MAERGLLVDYGGVLTSNVFAAFNVFCAAEGLPHDSMLTEVQDAPHAINLMKSFAKKVR